MSYHQSPQSRHKAGSPSRSSLGTPSKWRTDEFRPSSQENDTQGEELGQLGWTKIVDDPMHVKERLMASRAGELLSPRDSASVPLKESPSPEKIPSLREDQVGDGASVPLKESSSIENIPSLREDQVGDGASVPLKESPSTEKIPSLREDQVGDGASVPLKESSSIENIPSLREDQLVGIVIELLEGVGDLQEVYDEKMKVFASSVKDFVLRARDESPFLTVLSVQPEPLNGLSRGEIESMMYWGIHGNRAGIKRGFPTMPLRLIVIHGNYYRIITSLFEDGLLDTRVGTVRMVDDLSSLTNMVCECLIAPDPYEEVVRRYRASVGLLTQAPS